jgi:DNA end-binding protein Ku
VRDESEFFKGIGSHRVPEEMVSLASHILDSKAGHFDPGKFKDEFELALRKLVKRKAAGKTIEAPEEKRTAQTSLTSWKRCEEASRASARPCCDRAAKARREASLAHSGGSAGARRLDATASPA